MASTGFLIPSPAPRFVPAGVQNVVLLGSIPCCGFGWIPHSEPSEGELVATGTDPHPQGKRSPLPMPRCFCTTGRLAVKGLSRGERGRSRQLAHADLKSHFF